MGIGTMVKSKELTVELIAYSDKKGIDLVGFCDPAYFNKYNREHNPKVFLKNSKTVIGFYLYDISLDAWSKDKKKDRSYNNERKS